MITEHVYSNSFIDSAVNVSCSRLLYKRQTLNMLWLHFIYIKIKNLKKVSIGKQNESNPIFICILFSNASMLYKSILLCYESSIHWKWSFWKKNVYACVKVEISKLKDSTAALS